MILIPIGLIVAGAIIFVLALMRASKNEQAQYEKIVQAYIDNNHHKPIDE